MASPQITLTISLGVVAAVYSFWCNIRIAGKSSKIRERLEQEAPRAWSALNPIARNWNGGQPGIKLLHRQKSVNFPGFEDDVKQLLTLERKMLWGMGLAMACIGLVAAGTKFWGWQW